MIIAAVVFKLVRSESSCDSHNDHLKCNLSTNLLEQDSTVQDNKCVLNALSG